ncbi:MAG: hypothetical protein HGA47_01495, partial [Zoogloea sp.]|nr:hypothetical protein [Zoogloea sp.]
EAEGDVASFNAVLEQYVKAADVTRTRLFLETMSELLPQAGQKIIVDDSLRQLLPILPLCSLLGWEQQQIPEYGVLMQSADLSFILAIDSFAGREDAVIKSLDDFRPKGVAGVTTLSNGQIVLILDMKELLSALGDSRGVPRAKLIRSPDKLLTA